MSRPTSYQDWMKELHLATSIQDSSETRLPGMLTAATMMGKLNPKEARHDIALVLVAKYKEETARSNGNSMLLRPISEKYDLVAKQLFNSQFRAILNYVNKNEPNFDIRETNVSQGRTPPGFLGAVETVDEKGRVRSPLGFMKKPDKVDENGNVLPGLGFLGDESVGKGSLGFL